MDTLLNVSIPLWALIAYMVLMCAVQAMPRPDPTANSGYVWAYRFLHLLCMNLALFTDPLKKLKGELPEAAVSTASETTTRSVSVTLPTPPPVEGA